MLVLEERPEIEDEGRGRGTRTNGRRGRRADGVFAQSLNHFRAGAGFTLVELLLAVVLILLLVGALVFSFSTLRRGAELEEGAVQFESLVRFARAYSANSGRQVQMTFDQNSHPEPASASLRVRWEPDPLGEPGVFADLPEAQAYVRAVTDLVRAEQRVAQVGSSNRIETASAEAMASTNMTTSVVTFFPDGSSDSAEIMLASRDDEDERRMIMHLSEVGGSLRKRIIIPATRQDETEVPEEEDETEEKAENPQ